MTLGTATDDHGELYELNGLAGVPVGTFVVVHRVANTSGGPIWYFDGQQDAYGVAGSGAWVEITGHSSGAYSWKQKDPDATTDTVPAVTGANNAHTVNETEGIPNGTIVWLRFDGTDYRFEYDRLNFWAKITGESSGSYSWTELEGDATTTTTRTGTTNAEEVSGRLGIPTNSIVYMVPNQIDSNEYKFEYHGAHAGTLEVVDSGTSTTANSDTWARDSQGSDRGVDHPFVARIAIDSASGAVYAFCREKTYDANGHLLTISAENRKQIFTLDPTAITCATELAPDDASISSGLYCWLDASQLGGLSDTDSVTTYTDMSSSGNSPTQSTSSLKPVYRTNIYNSLPTVRFDGTDDYMDKIANLLPVGSDFTLIVVAKSTCISNNDGTTETNPGGGLGTAYRVVEEGGALKQTVGWLGSAVVGSTGGPNVNILRHTASSDTESWQDGVAGGTISHQWPSQYQDLILGRYNDGASFIYDPMDLCELALYSTNLTDEQVEQVTCYLLTKWGI